MASSTVSRTRRDWRPFVHRLRGFEQQGVDRFDDGALAVGLGGQIFKRAGFPGQNSPERRLAARALGFGVNQFAVLNPEFGHERAARDAQHGGTARKAFHLDDVHETLALDAAKAAVFVAAQQRFQAVDEHLGVALHLGLEPEQIHAQRVGARTEILVLQPAQHHGAQFGITAADDGQHLQAVNARHLQIANQQAERLGFKHRQRAFAGVGGADFRLAGKLREHFPAQFKPVRIVIQNQNFMLDFHSK